MPRAILEPNEAELKWIDANLQTVQSAIRAFAPQPGERNLLTGLDAAFAGWLSQHDPQQEDPNPYINAFGIGFGQYLADHLDLKWALVSDDNGAEIAVHGQPGDILIFPPNFVAKRYMTRDTGFFGPIYAQMEKEIADLRRDAPPKSRWKLWSRGE